MVMQAKVRLPNAPLTDEGKAIKILQSQIDAMPQLIGKAVFSVTAGVLTVHYQQGLVLTRASVGIYNIVFNQVQPNAIFTFAIHHTRYVIISTPSCEYCTNILASGCLLILSENGVYADAAPMAGSASIMIWSTP